MDPNFTPPLHSGGNGQPPLFILRKVANYELVPFLLSEVATPPSCPLEWEWSAISILKEIGEEGKGTARHTPRAESRAPRAAPPGTPFPR